MRKRALLMIAFVGSALSGFASSAYAAEFDMAEDTKAMLKRAIVAVKADKLGAIKS